MGDGESKDHKFKFGQLSTLLEETNLDFRTEARATPVGHVSPHTTFTTNLVRLSGTVPVEQHRGSASLRDRLQRGVPLGGEGRVSEEERQFPRGPTTLKRRGIMPILGMIQAFQ